MVRFHNPCSADTGKYLFFLLTLIQWSPILNNSSNRAILMQSLRLQGAHCIVIGPLGTSMPAEPHTNGCGHQPLKQGAGNQLCQVCINCFPGYMDLIIKKKKMVGILSYLILGIPKPIRWHINIDITPLFQWVFFSLFYWPYKQGAGNQLCQVCISKLSLSSWVYGSHDKEKCVGMLSYLILGIPKPIRWHIYIDIAPLFQWVFFTILL